MPESCASCQWSRPAVSRMATEYEFWGKEDKPEIIERRRCVRFPQAVENDATHWCGEFLAKAARPS